MTTRADQPPFGFVVQTPDESLYTKPTFCPYGCKDAKIIERDCKETLVGGGREANHEWHYCTCRNCERDFVREDAHGATWYTDKHKVLVGFPNCYEGYKFNHAGCEGVVTRKYTKLDGETDVDYLSSKNVNGKLVNEYRIFFVCKKCKAKVERVTE